MKYENILEMEGEDLIFEAINNENFLKDTTLSEAKEFVQLLAKHPTFPAALDRWRRDYALRQGIDLVRVKSLVNIHRSDWIPGKTLWIWSDGEPTAEETPHRTNFFDYLLSASKYGHDQALVNQFPQQLLGLGYACVTNEGADFIIAELVG